ncbi:FtsB family cell division protein [Rubrimonas cliftonensis]|uniref:Septum formation initiator n=1 Tax=Rubrimonas cliftonensis TaxID=89524 RepID=A0A1H3ZFV0_9RHOB|nr:septum formation initiator family protein [Rubrimonas cliftonensis]SEA22570.1 Septum formation initiator [Rubrimonas cliftonensis]
MAGDGKGVKVIDAVFALLMLAGLANFGHHALQGDYGVFAMIAIEAEESKLTSELALLRTERAAMENRAQRLDTAYLDLDLLDESARDVLGLMRADERLSR